MIHMEQCLQFSKSHAIHLVQMKITNCLGWLGLAPHSGGMGYGYGIFQMLWYKGDQTLKVEVTTMPGS